MDMTVITPFLWAAVITTPAAIAGFGALFFAKSGRLRISTAAVLAGAVRLLLAVAGSAIIIRFITVSVLWFVFWLIFLYFAVLGAEVYLAILIANNNKQRAKV
jgi:hypothetical protein